MSKKIAILGSGANGTSIGVDLTRAGLDVKLIDQWPAHVEAMRERGAIINRPDGTFQQEVDAYHLCDVATFTEPFDIVLMLFKAYDTRWAAHLIEPYLAEDGLLVGVQNGMTAETIAEVVGPERTLGCVIEIASEMYEPGEILRHVTPEEGSWFALGSFDPSTEDRVEEVAEVMRHAGVVEESPDILSAKWMKLVLNSMVLSTSALVGMGVEESLEVPELRELSLKCGAEALAAGAERGHSIQPIFGLKPEDMKNTNQLLETVLDKLLSFTLPDTKTTVLQDHVKGRQSETDDVNGLVAETLQAAGKPAPANAAIVELTARIKRGELKPDPDNLALLREMVAM